MRFVGDLMIDIDDVIRERLYRIVEGYEEDDSYYMGEAGLERSRGRVWRAGEIRPYKPQLPESYYEVITLELINDSPTWEEILAMAKDPVDFDQFVSRMGNKQDVLDQAKIYRVAN